MGPVDPGRSPAASCGSEPPRRPYRSPGAPLFLLALSRPCLSFPQGSTEGHQPLAAYYTIAIPCRPVSQSQDPAASIPLWCLPEPLRVTRLDDDLRRAAVCESLIGDR